MIKKHTQNNVDEPGPQLVVEPPPQGQFPLSGNVYNSIKRKAKAKYFTDLLQDYANDILRHGAC